MKRGAWLVFLAGMFIVSVFPQPNPKVDEVFWSKKEFWEGPALKTPYKPDLSEDEKIAGLSKFWSEVKYNFINFPLVPDLDWDKTYLEFLPKVRATKSTLEYYRVLQEFCARLKDGHTNIYEPDQLDDEVYAKPAVATRLVEGKVILLAVYDEKLKQEGLAAGQEVMAIDGAPVKEYAAKNIIPYASESTPQALDNSVYSRFLLNGALAKPVELTLKTSDGKVFKKVLPRLKWQEVNKLRPAVKGFEMVLLPGNIAHLKLNNFEGKNRREDKTLGDLFAENYAAIEKADALILDLRNNGGGNSGVGYQILAYLTDTPFKTSKWYTRNYRPTYRAWGRAQEKYGEDGGEATLEEIKMIRGANTKAYTKPVIVLISPRTGSAAEDFLVAFKPLKRGLIIGEPSNGSTGQPMFLTLPGGGSARICSKHDSFADGTEFVGVGVLPDVAAAPKIADFIAGKDSVLQLAVVKLTTVAH